MERTYRFETDDVDVATAALLIYAIYRSRNLKRFKVSPDMWSQIERFVKASAKRSQNIPRFIESLKPRLCCETIHPRWMEVGIKGLTPIVNSAGYTEYMQDANSREFLTPVVNRCDQKRVIELLYKETAYCVLLVRARLEEEKLIESRIDTDTGEIIDE